MKKILCIAVFSIAIMANATDKKEVATNNSKEIVLNTTNEKEIVTINFKEIKTVNNKCSKEASENEILAGCGAQGNVEYAKYRYAGWSHRQARSLRRDFVRSCRGGTWTWLNVFIFYYN